MLDEMSSLFIWLNNFMVHQIICSCDNLWLQTWLVGCMVGWFYGWMVVSLFG